MKQIKLWESNLKNSSIFFQDLDALLEYIREKGCIPVIRNSYTPGDKEETYFDKVMSKKEQSLIYTDKKHPVSFLKLSGVLNIDPDFFKKNKEQITKVIKETMLNKEAGVIIIKDYLYDEQFIKSLIKINSPVIFFESIRPSRELINYLEDHEIDSYYLGKTSKEQLTNKYCFKFYSKKALQKLDHLMILEPLNEKELANLKHLNPKAKIEINYSVENEEQLYCQVEQLTSTLENLGKPNQVLFPVYHRQLFNRSQLFNKNHKSVKLLISNDLNEYTLAEYQQEEAKLDSLISKIKASNLSPFEKYISVYNIVKNYKPYKENQEESDQSRYLRYILDNEYIVCLGYAKLLITLLERVGISSTEYSTGVDLSYDQGFTMENKPVTIGYHSRVLFNMDDDKYNIHGIYISDPTWDNDLTKEYLNHAIMTFDDTTTEERMMQLSSLDLVFDVHNFDDFNEKINTYLNHRMALYPRSYKIEQAYEDLYNIVMPEIKELDKEQYKELKEIPHITPKDNEQFLTELGKYIIPRTNQQVSGKTILEANKQARKILNHCNPKDEEEKYLNLTLRQNLQSEKKVFPYRIVSPDNLYLADNDQNKFQENLR